MCFSYEKQEYCININKYAIKRLYNSWQTPDFPVSLRAKVNQSGKTAVHRRMIKAESVCWLMLFVVPGGAEVMKVLN